MQKPPRQHFDSRLLRGLVGRKLKGKTYLKESYESGDTPSETSGVWLDENDLVDADDEEAPLTTFIATDHSYSQEIGIVCKLERKHSIPNECKEPQIVYRRRNWLPELVQTFAPSIPFPVFNPLYPHGTFQSLFVHELLHEVEPLEGT